MSTLDESMTRRRAIGVSAGLLGAALLPAGSRGAAPEARRMGAATSPDTTIASDPAAAARPARRAGRRPAAELPRTMALVEAARARGGSGQLYVSFEGEVLADVAWGRSPLGTEMTTASIVSWASAVKPLTCTCLMKLWEAGRLDLDDRVTRFIPEFGVNGKEEVRIRHLLTHTAHLGGYAGPQRLAGGYDGVVRGIVQAPRQGAGGGAPPTPGTRPGYNPAGIWIVAEIARRLHGRPFDQVIRRELFEPLGMEDSWVGMPASKLREYRADGRLASNYLADEATAPVPQPAGGGLGPTRELARFYEMMLGRGILGGRRIVSPQTVEAMTSQHTELGPMGSWGLGFNLNVAARGEANAAAGAADAAGVLQRYGPHASPRAFGHPGASGMLAWADPEYGLVVAVIGRVPVAAAIYEDLGFVRG